MPAGVRSRARPRRRPRDDGRRAGEPTQDVEAAFGRAPVDGPEMLLGEPSRLDSGGLTRHGSASTSRSSASLRTQVTLSGCSWNGISISMHAWNVDPHAG